MMTYISILLAFINVCQMPVSSKKIHSREEPNRHNASLRQEKAACAKWEIEIGGYVIPSNGCQGTVGDDDYVSVCEENEEGTIRPFTIYYTPGQNCSLAEFETGRNEMSELYKCKCVKNDTKIATR